MLVKINPHVLPTQTAWQRRRKDNISTLPGCAAELQTVILHHAEGRKNSSRVQNTTYACNSPPVHTTATEVSLLINRLRLNRVATPCRLLTKVITSWLPSITSPHFFSADGGAADALKNNNRAAAQIEAASAKNYVTGSDE